MVQVKEVDAGGLEAGFSSAKKQILLTLKLRGAVSLSDISEALRISKMATLKHLNVLEAKGLVERSFKAGGRGRPRAFFNLSKSSATLFPEAGGVERERFQNLISADVETSHRVVAGDPVCRFLIRSGGLPRD